MKRLGTRTWNGLVAVAFALSSGACGGGGSGTGAGPTVPVAPTPTPVSGPTPEPPVSASCARLPPGNPDPTKCQTEAPTFLGDLEEQPGIFSGDQILNVGAYYVGLVRVLDRKGLCADFDGEELGVTNTRDYSDVFDVQTARDQVRQYYVGTCYPALVPIQRGWTTPPPAGCALPSSREIACGREPEGRFHGDVTAAIEGLLQSRPDLFDLADTNPGTAWPRVKDMDGYHAAMVSSLAAKGYCSFFDGEEIQVKRTNELTEHYDVNYSDKYIRTGAGIYRGSCYPAAF